jgi:two-component system, sensor histidine kinase
MFAIPPTLARRVLDAAPDAMVIIDTFGTIWFANRRVSALFGYAHHEIIGESIETLMPERFRAQHIEHRAQFLGNVRAMGTGLDLFGQRRDGTEFPLEVSLSPIEDVGQTLVAAAIRDVTDRKRIEAELIVARGAIEAMRDLADRANQDRKRFLEAAGHDLRQPLETVAHLNHTLRQFLTTPGAVEALAQQAHAIGAVSKLLKALLDIGKLESGAIKPVPTDFTIATLFEELRAEFTGIAATKGLQLEIETCDWSAHSDPTLVEHILRNLILNAIKFTREGRVRLHCLREAAFVRIEVLDSGAGIPPDQVRYIFDELQRAGPAINSHDGYGLGLSIVQRLAKLLRLEIEVRSEVGRGSAFTIVLPAGSGRAQPGRAVAHL